MKVTKKDQGQLIRTVRPVLWVALVLSITGATCQFFSIFNPDDSTLVFTPTKLPYAQTGAPYEMEISVENVKTFVGQFSVVEGQLPTGLSLERVPDENKVKITGTPTEFGIFDFTLEARCLGTNTAGQVGTQDYQIIVGDVVDTSLIFTPEVLPDAQTGVAYLTEIGVENVISAVDQFSVIVGELPPGLSLERVPNEDKVKISGTPTASGTFVFTLEATCYGTNDPGQVGEQEYQIVVK